jgi:hypothetical protein
MVIIDLDKSSKINSFNFIYKKIIIFLRLKFNVIYTRFFWHIISVGSYREFLAIIIKIL